jgi:hypothetical protein
MRVTQVTQIPIDSQSTRVQRAHTGEVIWKVRHLRHLRHPVGSGEAEIDFEKRRAAAARQSAYRRRRRLGRIVIALEAMPEDLIGAATTALFSSIVYINRSLAFG